MSSEEILARIAYDLEQIVTPHEFRFDWDGTTWYFTGRPIMKGMLVVGWWPLPDTEG